MTPEEYFADSPLGLEVFVKAHSLLEAYDDVQVRATKSQVSFRRGGGFAYIWAPGMYLANPDAEVVLSIALGRHDDSPRFKEVAHPSPKHWIHHLEVGDIDEVDKEVAAWLTEAAERAG